MAEEHRFLAGRALRQVVYQHFLSAVGVQRQATTAWLASEALLMGKMPSGAATTALM
ncbi:hypothetical protein [Hymenobacter lapidarius]|uniref:hypothetical protein n=1 Tax=Hymenobacter lapidarius TaxID=1908237 RepID=UPI0013019BFA|nr:hypothetical protein [Hymenobacter lapidarius]